MMTITIIILVETYSYALSHSRVLSYRNRRTHGSKGISITARWLKMPSNGPQVIEACIGGK